MDYLLLSLLNYTASLCRRTIDFHAQKSACNEIQLFEYIVPTRDFGNEKLRSLSIQQGFHTGAVLIGGRLVQLPSNSHSVIRSAQAMEDLYTSIMHTYRVVFVYKHNAHIQGGTLQA